MEKTQVNHEERNLRLFVYFDNGDDRAVASILSGGGRSHRIRYVYVSWGVKLMKDILS
jgi:hypothetical protein